VSRALVLVAVAACASPKRAPAPPASSVKELLALLDSGAARACACTDRACTEAAETDLAHDVDGAKVSATWVEDGTAREQAETAEWRTIRCMQAHDTTAYGFEALAVRYMSAEHDALCACHDDPCVAKVQAAMGPAYRHVVAVPIDNDAANTMTQLDTQITACVRAPHAAALDAWLGQMSGFRDRACACRDAACADAVTADFQTWAHAAPNVRTSQEEIRRIQTTGREIGACLEDARRAH
jgi:hypothetical protein